MRAAAVLCASAVLLPTGCSPDGDQSTVESATASPTPTVSGAPNGIEDLPPEEVLRRAREAARKARSVHVVATSDNATLDMRLKPDASSGNRSVGEQSISTRVVDDALFIKAPESYWAQAFPAAKAGQIDGRWVAADLADPKLRNWRMTTTLKSILRTFLTAEGASAVGEPSVQQGQPAVPVTTTLGTVWVATTGEPYVLLIVSPPEAPTPSRAEFTEWDEPLRIEEPPAGRTMDISELS